MWGLCQFKYIVITRRFSPGGETCDSSLLPADPLKTIPANRQPVLLLIFPVVSTGGEHSKRGNIIVAVRPYDAVVSCQFSCHCSFRWDHYSLGQT